jgi:hypothetical protein
MKHSLTNGFWFAKNSLHFNLNRLAMTLLFVASVTACNKEEFYQKDFLDNPYADDTSETTGDSTGGETSGVDSGVTSGSTDGTTGGSSTGDSTSGGSTTGDSTSGGTVGGSTTGGSTTGDSTSGGTVGGSTSGGATTGDTTGGSTSGGATTGDTTGGSTSGGATTGDTTGGSTSGGSTTGSTTGGIGDCNNGHGNDDDGVDDSNPGQGKGGPNASKDPNVSEVCYAEEKFQQAAEQTKKIDILWVIDNSGSMADEQKALGENFDAFIKGFISKNVDFNMAITTTDTSSEAKKGAIVPGSNTALTSAAAKADEQKFYENFLSMVQVGIKGSGYEKGLAATEGFVSKYSSWIRPEAYLAVVVLSDEEDQSSEAVKFYTDNLKAQKSVTEFLGM